MKNKLGFSHGKGFKNSLSNMDKWQTGNTLPEHGVYIVKSKSTNWCWLVVWAGSVAFSSICGSITNIETNSGLEVKGSLTEQFLKVSETGKMTMWSCLHNGTGMADNLYTDFYFCKVE